MNDKTSTHRKVAGGRILRDVYPEVDSADPVDYVAELGDSVQALMYSWLFWPDLVEFEGAVFVAIWGNDEQFISERIRNPSGGWRRSPISWKETVDSFNIFEVDHMFRQYRGSVEVAAEANSELGHVLVQAWNARLKMAYTTRSFRVRFVEADELMDSRIEVSQDYPSLVTPRGWNAEQRSILPRVRLSGGDPINDEDR